MNPDTPSPGSETPFVSDAQTAMGADAPSVAELAHSASDYAKAWSDLLVQETRLARVSAIRLIFAAMLVPMFALGIFVALNAGAAAFAQHWLHDWSASIAAIVLLDIAGLWLVLLAMQRWWRNLSLPRSRAALTRVLRRAA